MNNVYQLEGAYLVISPNVSQEMLKGALVYIYQVDVDIVSGIILNKPFLTKKTAKDFLEYPKQLLHLPVWQGGPVSTDRLIAYSQSKRDVYITDRLINLTQEQQEQCLFLVGQCVWDLPSLMMHIKMGDYWLIGSKSTIPNKIPAEERIPYLLKLSGIKQNLYVPQKFPEVV
jgi:putative AlgH/UPF0301 family transcriptional regulator